MKTYPYIYLKRKLSDPQMGLKPIKPADYSGLLLTLTQQK